MILSKGDDVHHCIIPSMTCSQVLTEIVFEFNVSACEKKKKEKTEVVHEIARFFMSRLF